MGSKAPFAVWSSFPEAPCAVGLDVSGVEKEGVTMKRTWFVAGVALAMLEPARAVAQDRTWERQWSMHPMMFMWGTGGLAMMLMMLVFWGLVIAGAVVGLRWLIAQKRPERRDEALEILRQRHARGEIDKQEFETCKRDLGR
jgi:putative membrane protein